MKQNDLCFDPVVGEIDMDEIEYVDVSSFQWDAGLLVCIKLTRIFLLIYSI